MPLGTDAVTAGAEAFACKRANCRFREQMKESVIAVMPEMCPNCMAIFCGNRNCLAAPVGDSGEDLQHKRWNKIRQCDNCDHVAKPILLDRHRMAIYNRIVVKCKQENCGQRYKLKNRA